MILTNELRWVKRTIPAPEYGQDVGKATSVLQQKWLHYDDEPSNFEWRDVPLEEE